MEPLVLGQRLRLTFHSTSCLRCEYSPAPNQFEDRPSQVFHRSAPLFSPSVKNHKKSTKTTVTTEYYKLEATVPETGAVGVSISFASPPVVWNWASDAPDLKPSLNDSDKYPLFGTTKTLDSKYKQEYQFEVPAGLISRKGYSIIDDTSSLVFGKDWIQPRNAPDGYLDFFVFAYGTNYQQCLVDFANIAGRVPLVPRFALGLWWSKWYKYTQQDLVDIVNDFEEHDLPLSALVIDMDWHIVSNPHHNGWTGYTWNKELFPDPKKLMDFCHRKGIKVTLNLHAHAGVAPHEAAYEEFAKLMGMDPEKKQTIEFRLEDPKFAEGYLKLLHHPLEAQGVDFWWNDWQHGSKCTMPGLDILWWMNHIHCQDIARDGKSRPLLMSRWGGRGNHRFPFGFSGDTIAEWRSLEVIGEFTASACANELFLWSHDVGGFMWSQTDPEYYIRWVQFASLMPTFRFHSHCNKYEERIPWKLGTQAYHVAKDLIHQRFGLVSFLYSTLWRMHAHAVPFVAPVYFSNPTSENAYLCPQEFVVGSSLLVSPISSPCDPATRHARKPTYFPEGLWFDFATGRPYRGDQWLGLQCRLDEFPVFAKAGSIIPTQKKVTSMPKGFGYGGELEILVFPGASNSFLLYEDSGESMAYADSKRPECCLRDIVAGWTPSKKSKDLFSQGSLALTLKKATGVVDLSPAKQVSVLFKAVYSTPKKISVRINDSDAPADTAFTVTYSHRHHTVKVTLLKPVVATDEIVIAFEDYNIPSKSCGEKLPDQNVFQLEDFNRLILWWNAMNNVKDFSVQSVETFIQDLTPATDKNLFWKNLRSVDDSLTLALIDLLVGCGFYKTVTMTGETIVVVWNNKDMPDVAIELVTLVDGVEMEERIEFTAGQPAQGSAASAAASTDAVAPSSVEGDGNVVFHGGRVWTRRVSAEDSQRQFVRVKVVFGPRFAQEFTYGTPPRPPKRKPLPSQSDKCSVS